MKTNKYVDELKAKSADELQTELVSAKKELFNLKFQNATNQLDNTARIKEVRRNIARIQTVITQNAKAHLVPEEADAVGPAFVPHGEDIQNVPPDPEGAPLEIEVVPLELDVDETPHDLLPADLHAGPEGEGAQRTGQRSNASM